MSEHDVRNRSRPALLALLLSVVALAVALAAQLGRSDGGIGGDAAAGSGTAPSAAAFAELSSRLDGLEQRAREATGQIERLRREVQAPAARVALDGAGAPMSDANAAELHGAVAALRAARLEEVWPRLDDVARRLTLLEQQYSAAAMSAAAAAAATARRRALTAEEMRARVAELTPRMADATASEEERLVALRELRGLGRDARRGAVAVAAVELAQRSQDATVRADVWRQMHGAKDPALLQPLLRAVVSDPDREVREEAAETLDDFLDQPGVRQTLEQVRDGDADEGVRRQAARSLSRR